MNLHAVTRITNNLRSKKVAKELLHLTDKQLKGLGLTQDVATQQINRQDTSTYNVPANDDGILSVA